MSRILNLRLIYVNEKHNEKQNIKINEYSLNIQRVEETREWLTFAVEIRHRPVAGSRAERRHVA